MGVGTAPHRARLRRRQLHHGYETLPDDLVGFVCQVAGRAYATPATDGGVSQETLGAYSYTIGSAAAAGVDRAPPGRAGVARPVFCGQLGVIYVSQ
jgi:hypothetical protein